LHTSKILFIFSNIIFQHKIILNLDRKAKVLFSNKETSTNLSQIIEIFLPELESESETPPQSFLPSQRRRREDLEELPGCQRTLPGRRSIPGPSNFPPGRRRGCGTTGPWRGAGG